MQLKRHGIVGSPVPPHLPSSSKCPNLTCFTQSWLRKHWEYLIVEVSDGKENWVNYNIKRPDCYLNKIPFFCPLLLKDPLIEGIHASLGSVGSLMWGNERRRMFSLLSIRTACGCLPRPIHLLFGQDHKRHLAEDWEKKRARFYFCAQLRL